MITKLKGKDLKRKILVKILSEDLKMGDFQYELGKNTDVNQLSKANECAEGEGLHFCEAKDILRYLNYGTKLAIVHVSDEEDVVCNEYYGHKYRSQVLHIDKVMDLTDTKTWNWLIEHGADIHAENDDALCWAVENGHLNVVKCLVEHGANIHTRNDYVLRHAADRGYLNVVKYLVEHGANIHTRNDIALRWAAKNGHLDVVKYLVEHGGENK